MTDWRDDIARIAGELSDQLRGAGDAIARELGGARGYQIAGYRGYGTAHGAQVLGRVIQERGIAPASEHDSAWRNLLNTYKRLDSDPLPFARVRARLAGTERMLVADNEGFFCAWLPVARPLPEDTLWHTVDLELLPTPGVEPPAMRATGSVLAPPPSAAFGVISDIDDTVIQSRVSNFLQAARTVMLGNARTRLPFPGVAAFYQALQRGATGSARNPIFYVSSSPWNLYDVIGDFLDIQGIPSGPLLLRDWDLNRLALSSGRHLAHKGSIIRQILATYPALPFILIGDSGQHDPEIYSALVREFPRRILAVYIRNVTQNPERSASIRQLADDVLAAGSTLILADDSMAATRHAAEHGWIARDALEAVQQDRRADEGATGAKVEAPAADTPGAPAPTIILGDEGRPRES